MSLVVIGTPNADDRPIHARRRYEKVVKRKRSGGFCRSGVTDAPEAGPPLKTEIWVDDVYFVK